MHVDSQCFDAECCGMYGVSIKWLAAVLSIPTLLAARGKLDAQEHKSQKTWVMSQQMGREQPQTADRKCWRETRGVSPTKWMPTDSWSLRFQTFYWNEVLKLIISHVNTEAESGTFICLTVLSALWRHGRWSLFSSFFSNQESSEYLMWVPWSSHISNHSVLIGELNTLQNPWGRTQVTFSSQACVLINDFPIRSLWLTPLTLVSFDSLLSRSHVKLFILSQGFSALSCLRSSFSRSWHSICQIFSVFWICSSLPAFVKTNSLVWRVPQLIIWIFLTKNSLTIFRNHLILITEVYYSPLYLMEYEVFLYHCNNGEQFWSAYCLYCYNLNQK